MSTLNWLLLVVAVGHTGWVDGTGKQSANLNDRGTDFHFGTCGHGNGLCAEIDGARLCDTGLQTFRYFETVTQYDVKMLQTISYNCETSRSPPRRTAACSIPARS